MRLGLTSKVNRLEKAIKIKEYAGVTIITPTSNGYIDQNNKTYTSLDNVAAAVLILNDIPKGG